MDCSVLREESSFAGKNEISRRSTEFYQNSVLLEVVLNYQCDTPGTAAKGYFMKGCGCGVCNKSGNCVFELMITKIRKMTVLFEDGIRKVLQGVPSVKEVLRTVRTAER